MPIFIKHTSFSPLIVEMFSSIKEGAVYSAYGCLEWPGQLTGDGYGVVALGGRRYLAHRVAWYIEHGEIPAGANICHRCDNPRCILPAHLFAGTQLANMRDKAVKGRAARSLAKLDMEKAVAIRADTRPIKEIAASFDVSSSTVTRIKQGLIWRERYKGVDRRDQYADSIIYRLGRGEHRISITKAQAMQIVELLDLPDVRGG